MSSFKNIQENVKEKEEKDENQYINVMQKIQFHK